MEENNESLCVGIDLGTSRSSISASNGERHVVDSYVGWPVDMVARKLVKKPVMIGREALDNRPMLDLRRPLERGIMKEGSDRDQEAVQELVRHLISLAGIKHKGKNKSKVRAVIGETLIHEVGHYFGLSEEEIEEIEEKYWNSR